MKALLDDIKKRMDLAKLIHDRENLPEGNPRLKNENYGRFAAYAHCHKQLKKIKFQQINPELLEELRQIRDEILEGVEDNDLLYIKMQVNKIDTLMFKILTKGENHNSGNKNV